MLYILSLINNKPMVGFNKTKKIDMEITEKLTLNGCISDFTNTLNSVIRLKEKTEDLINQLDRIEPKVNVNKNLGCCETETVQKHLSIVDCLNTINNQISDNIEVCFKNLECIGQIIG